MQKVVLVTGASSGIGWDTVRALTENNFLVVATVRKPEDKERIEKKFNDKVRVILLDVADWSSVDLLPDQLRQKFQIQKLYGLVNNAGIALAAPFSEQDFSEIQNTININVLSVMKITQVLIPMMSENSRIVNISSIAGKNASPFLAAYGASKHAVEGFSDALRKELMLLGIKVSIVAPGSIKTPIWQKGFGLIKEKYLKSVFAESFSRFMKIAGSQEKHALDVGEVSRDILHALTAECPKIRYAPMPRPLVNWYLPKLIPTRIYDKMTAKVLGLDRT